MVFFAFTNASIKILVFKKVFFLMRGGGGGGELFYDSYVCSASSLIKTYSICTLRFLQ